MEKHSVSKNIKKYPIASCIFLFIICGLARLIEYFIIRTDRTILQENVFHKVFGIILLAAVLHFLRDGWQSIGFTKSKSISGVAKGFLLGCVCFSAAYSIECLILYRINGHVSLSFYVSGFSLNGETIKHTGILFFTLCIVFNLINVWMEEGVFRGLFMKILAEKLSFCKAALLIAFLFGIWHWVMPLRDYAEGNSSLAGLLAMGIGYILLAGMMSIKWTLLYQMTGSLWMGLGDHLFNNVIATNLLHVISNNEADSLQIVRILIGQILSFIIIAFIAKKFTHKKI
ncbi:MAG: CPBP family intramembrane metalloprotease [Clostridium sp.]|nr:CPBP family intramembrane metalloprotease [Clostridium sp.]